jgi:hypothetical protein
VYATGIRPKSNSTCWFKLHIACDELPVHLTSTNESETNDYFSDTDNKAYLCSVQDSDDTVDLCDLIYSGPFTNYMDVEKHIRMAIASRSKDLDENSISFGVRLKKNKEIPEPKFTKNWLIKPNMMLHIEVDRLQAKTLKSILYVLFNKATELKPRPGGYNFRILPDKSQIRTGSKGDQDHKDMLGKHVNNTKSLEALKSYDLRDLDKEVNENGHTYTLRQLLLELPYPLNPEDKGPPPQKMFFSVDKAPSGQDKDRDVVYLTAYLDRKDTAAKLVDILPAYINHKWSPNLAHAFCKPDALAMIHEIKFTKDEDGNDDGEWTTTEDEMGRDIIEEQMEFQIDMEGLDITADRDYNRKINNVDDLSAATFGTALGAGPTYIDDQSDTEVPGACHDTINTGDDSNEGGTVMDVAGSD